MSELLGLKKMAEILNFSEEEIMELIRQKRIPHLYYSGEDKYLFPKEEVLSAITPRPKKQDNPAFGTGIDTETETKEPVVPRRGRPKKQT